MSEPDFHQEDYYEPYVQEMSSELQNTIPTPGRYWGFVLFTAFVLLSYQLVGIFAILYESGVFAIPQMYFTKSARGADKYNTFSIFMFCCWQYVVVHEIAYSNSKVGKLVFLIFTLISAFIGMEFIFATPDTIIPLELQTEKGVNFFKNFFRLVILSYQTICFVIILPFLLSNRRLIISPYEKATPFEKNMSIFPMWFPFAALIVTALLLVFISPFTGGNITSNSNTDSNSSSSSDIAPSITTAEVKEEIQALLSRYINVIYLDSTVFIENGVVTYISVDLETSRNYIKSIVSELRELAPSARILLYDKNMQTLYED